MAFNYPPLLLTGQLDGEVFFNNCPGYSVLTVHSFCVVRRVHIFANIFLEIVWGMYGLPRPNN
ncbi:hypothetical protein HU200_002927 [Digitaria exilis]|uniref:Uncharacterized protein n=1 Tax=Digitaria exilis TaxID=1010633 RepID=A0A835KWF7_9POAL|nr:hypothetical protein HU200_002927 [Digitaria exilis]